MSADSRSPAHGWPVNSKAPCPSWTGHFDRPDLDVFVGNLPYYVNDQALFDMATEHGTALRVRIVCDRESGDSRGYGFVRAATPEDQRAIIAGLHNRMIGRRALHARPLSQGSNRRSGGIE